MIRSLQQIYDSIPADSDRVKHYFTLATAPDPVDYSTFKRYVYATAAIAGSLITATAGSVVMTNRIIMILFIKFDNPLASDLERHAKAVYSSLYFAAALTAYLFKTYFRGSANDLILDLYKLKPEAKASYLKSTDEMEFLLGHEDFPEYEYKDSPFQLFVHASLNIDSIPETAVLYAIVNSRSDLVLVFSNDEKSAYLTPRSAPWVREKIMADSLVFRDMPPLPKPAVEPVPKPKQDPLPEPKPAAEPLPPADKEEEVPAAPEEIEAPSGLTFAFKDPAPESQTMAGQLFGDEHIFKQMKYRHTLAHFYHLATSGEGLELYNRVHKSKTDPALRNKCVQLYEILNQPEKYTVRDQYNGFIDALCDAARSLNAESDSAFREWIHFLSYNRYTGVSLAGYYKSLVVSSLGEIPELNLDNFGTVLNHLNHKAEELKGSQGLTWAARSKQQLFGHFSIKDFGKGPNIPAHYGQLKIDGKTINIIRHGTPISQNSLPFFRTIEIKPDYTAFLEAANEKDEKLLHVILENAIPKPYAKGDESERVKPRLDLDKHRNVYTLALRFDGDFVQPKNYAARPIENLKKAFTDQMFGKDTGYVVPAKLNFSQERFNEIMDKVLNEFFAGKAQLDTLQEHQAFIALTYAEMIFSLCKSLDISYLEALCKDDKDRGGVMKAVIVLLHLYRAGKFKKGQEKQLAKALEELMVNIVAIPLTITKDAIIESRCAYIKNVLNVLRETVAKGSEPANAYEGNFNVQSDPYQRAVPMGGTCRTKQEYAQFLQQINTIKPTFRENIMESLQPLFNNQQLGYFLTSDYKIRDTSGKEIAQIHVTDGVISTTLL